MHWTFIKAFMRNPRHVGAIAPSSPHLAREIVSQIDLSRASVILEFGPGMGAFTSEILARKPLDSHYLAIERDPAMAATFRKRFPDAALYVDSAEKSGEILKSRGLPAADCIISGLPWAAFDRHLQDRLLDATLSALTKGGWFATFAYLQGLMLPSGRRFRDRLEHRFSEVIKSRVVWRNLPPAFVYRCRK